MRHASFGVLFQKGDWGIAHHFATGSGAHATTTNETTEEGNRCELTFSRGQGSVTPKRACNIQRDEQPVRHNRPRNGPKATMRRDTRYGLGLVDANQRKHEASNDPTANSHRDLESKQASHKSSARGRAGMRSTRPTGGVLARLLEQHLSIGEPLVTERNRFWSPSALF